MFLREAGYFTEEIGVKCKLKMFLTTKMNKYIFRVHYVQAPQIDSPFALRGCDLTHPSPVQRNQADLFYL